MSREWLIKNKKTFERVLAVLLIIVLPIFLVGWNLELLHIVLPFLGRSGILLSLVFMLAWGYLLVPPLLLAGALLALLLGFMGSTVTKRALYWILGTWLLAPAAYTLVSLLDN
jgi:uncharacterized membrane protein AbrB (regulator of aidB expression)